MSDDSPAVPSAESLQALRQKHPSASSSLSNLPSAQSVQCMSVDKDEVRRAVLSFSPGSAGGPDGLRPQHIRDMLMCQEAGTEFLSALTDFVNLVVAGRSFNYSLQHCLNVRTLARQLLCIVWATPMFSISKDFFESSLYSAACSQNKL